jgi:hypothetical protein
MACLGALAVFVLATVALALLVEPIPSWYFQLAWWSYIVAVDALNRRRAGRSLLRDRPREFLWLSGVSIVWWTLFEAINLRLGNWYYVMDHSSRLVGWAAGALAFATVLPGIVETLEWIEHRGWLRRLRVRPLRWSGAREQACLGMGALCLVLPLLWPEIFFPLVWLSFVLLVEPWNRRHAARSFLRDLEAGDAGPLCRTLLAGLVCGVLWESWNYWARTKWIYTVPWFDELKLFEMPVLGFLGFPPFAVECLVVVRFLATVRERFTRRTRRLAIPLGAAFTLGVFALVDPVTVDSHHRPVAQLATLAPDVRRRLSAAGFDTPERLLRADPRAVAAASGLAESELAAAVARVRLLLHRGLGDDRAGQLALLGIHSLEDLKRWRAADLAAALRAQRTLPRNRFLERRVAVWLR